jgi:hypothetical protein
MDAVPTEPILRLRLSAIRYTINNPRDKQPIKANSSQEEEEKLMPPELASKLAQLGICLYEQYGGFEKFRIPHLLAQSSPIPIKDIYEILDFFETNEFDRREAGWGWEYEPSVGWICWLMMGGDRAYSWARTVKRMRTAKIELPE